jgi:hypothetical protein
MQGDTELFSTHDKIFASEGILVPGETYRLLVWVKSPSRGFDVVGWSFEFALPEPHGTGFVALGLMLLIRLWDVLRSSPSN